MGVFTLPSHSVHGNWQDLITFHLLEEGLGFLPDCDWHPPRLQVVNVATILSTYACGNYLKTIPESGDRAVLARRVESAFEKAIKLDVAHEQFLATKQRTGSST